jgi:hypothetical protein
MLMIMNALGGKYWQHLELSAYSTHVPAQSAFFSMLSAIVWCDRNMGSVLVANA